MFMVQAKQLPPWLRGNAAYMRAAQPRVATSTTPQFPGQTPIDPGPPPQYQILQPAEQPPPPDPNQPGGGSGTGSGSTPQAPWRPTNMGQNPGPYQGSYDFSQVFPGSAPTQLDQAKFQQLQRLTQQQGRRITMQEWQDLGGNPYEYHRLYSGQPEQGAFGSLQQSTAAEGRRISFDEWVNVGGDPSRYYQLYGSGGANQALMQEAQARAQAEGRTMTAQEWITAGGDPWQYESARQESPWGAQAGTLTDGTNLGNVREIAAAQIGQSPNADWAQIAPTLMAGPINIGQIERANAPTIGQFQNADAHTVALQNAFRDKQMALSGQLEQQAAGEGPSLAGLQLQQALERSQKNQMGMLAAQPGMSPGMAARLFGQQAGQAQAEAGMQSAQARMAEQIAARQQLQQLYGTARGMDISIEQGNQAALNQNSQFNVQNQNARTAQQAAYEAQFGMYNSQAFNQRQMEQADLNTRLSLANQLAGNTQNYNQAQLTQQGNQFNSNLAWQRALQQAQMQQQAQMSNQQYFNQANISQGQIAQGIEQSQIGATAQTTSSQIAADAAVESAQIQAEAGMFGDILDLFPDQGPVNQAPSEDSPPSNVPAGSGSSGGGESGRYGRYSQYGQNLGSYGGYYGALSDKREKKDIKGGDAAANRMLDKMAAAIYRYKKGGGEQLGVMAQDLEKSPMGASAVNVDPEGKKRVDWERGMMSLFAGLSALHQRVKAMEGNKDAPR